MKRKREHSITPLARCHTVAGEGLKSKSHKLIVVFDEAAKTQVEEERFLRKVNCESWDFPKVRRNKKIQKVMQMERADTRTEIPVQLVTTSKQTLSKLDCVYDKSIVKVLQHPQKYLFTKGDWKHQEYWHIRGSQSNPILMESDFMQDEMSETLPEFESDIGVLMESVRQLMTKKSNDVMAINTHPGHHAAPRRATNYCAFNNAILAVGLMKKKDPNLKVGVIDIDIHPGDGTLRFVKQNRHLLDQFVSIHCGYNFWRSRMGHDFGNHGIKLKCTKGQVTSLRFQKTIKKVLKAWSTSKLDVIVVGLGFDTLKKDPLGGNSLGFQVLPADFYNVGHTFAQRPEQLFFIQEGGYDVTGSAIAFEYLVRGFRQGRKALTVGQS